MKKLLTILFLSLLSLTGCGNDSNSASVTGNRSRAVSYNIVYAYVYVIDTTQSISKMKQINKMEFNFHEDNTVNIKVTSASKKSEISATYIYEIDENGVGGYTISVDNEVLWTYIPSDPHLDGSVLIVISYGDPAIGIFTTTEHDAEWTSSAILSE